MTRRGQAGSSNLGSLLGLFFGGGAALVVAALFMTGLAQRQIIPWAQARAEQATGRTASAAERERTAPTAVTVGDPAGSAVALRDSLQALSAQIETQRAFLAQREAELTRIRAGIDSLCQTHKGADNIERKRQAKVLAAMKPGEAACVLERMDDATLALLLDAMTAKAAAKVMAKLDAGRVARLASRAVHHLKG